MLLICASGLAQAQEVLDNNPPSVKWNKIITPNFKVIFPANYAKEAQRVANTLEHIHEPGAKTIGSKPKKISIILQNQNSISNGFVTLGPRRSEFYTTPPQDYNFLGTNEWLSLLAVHEYRHIVQFQQSKTGFNKLFYFLFGQNTQAGFAFSAAPPWFWEGDATLIETTHTHSGRGRIPNHDLLFRSNLLEDKKIDYHKQHLRSFKDFIPDHYRLGFYMTSHVRRQTSDPEIWGKVTHRAFSWPFIPFTFSNAMKKETGKYVRETYRDMMGEMKTLWTNQLEGLDLTSFEKLNKRKNSAFTDYEFPSTLPDGRVVVLKSGIGDIQEFVAIDENGNEEILFTPGVMNRGAMLSVQDSKIVWNEFHFDPRWRVKTYSVIKTYDVETEYKTIVTRQSRYSSAALSPDGSQIATLRNTEEGENIFTILDASTGRTVREFANPDNNYYGMPRWAPDGTSIVALRTNNQGKTIVSFDALTGKEEALLPVSQENVGHPVVYDHYLFYNSPYSGIDNIYVLDLENGQKYQVTSSKYGAYNPHISNGYIYYNDHGRDGLDVARIPYDPSQWMPFEKVQNRNLNYFQPIVQQEGHEDILASVPDKVYPVSKHSKFKGFFNPHSWGPFASTDLREAQIGIFTQDVLSTTSGYVGYTYDVNEESGVGIARASYQALLPIIDVEVTRGNRSTSEGTINGEELRLKWEETGLEAGFRIPLVTTTSKYFGGLNFGNSVGVTRVNNFRNTIGEGGRFVAINDTISLLLNNELDNGTLRFNEFNFSAFRILKRSQRDINSKWGQTLNIENFSTPYGGSFDGQLWAIRSSLFFPGLFKHHSLFFNIGYQRQRFTFERNLYSFRNRIFKPRGFSFPNDEEFFSILGNYTLPIAYPDLSIGPLLNIQRIRANLFYDFGNGRGRTSFFETNGNRVFFSENEVDYISIGAELLFDINIFRFRPLFDVGVRFTYRDRSDLPQTDTTVEFILGSISF